MLKIVSFSDINECARNPCENQATCNDLVNFFNCTCLSGFTGDRCKKGMKNKKLMNLNSFDIDKSVI